MFELSDVLIKASIKKITLVAYHWECEVFYSNGKPSMEVQGKQRKTR